MSKADQIGRTIRILRKEKAMTQLELADGICNRTYISQCEKGLITPAPEILQKIAERLGTTIENLVIESATIDFTKIEIENAIRHVINKLDENNFTHATKWVNKIEHADLSTKQKSIYYWAKGKIAHNQQQFEDAEKYYLTSLDFGNTEYDNSNDPTPLVRTLTSLGIHYCQSGKAIQSIPHLNEALELSNRHEISSSERITMLFSIGQMHACLQEYHSAIEWLRKAEILSLQTGCIINTANILVVSGVCYRRLNNLDTALDYYKKALEMLKIAPSTSIESATHLNIAVLLRLQGKNNQALEAISLAMMIHEKAQDTAYWYNNCKVEKAHILKNTNKLSQAKELCEQVIASHYSKQTVAEAQMIMADTLLMMGDIQEAMKHIHNAYEYFRNSRRQDFIQQSLEVMNKIYAKKAGIEVDYSHGTITQ